MTCPINRFFSALILSVTVLAGSGCASITGTPNQSVSVQARTQGGKEVAGASCELTNNKGKWFVTTPGSVSIHRSNDDMQVLCNKDGIEPGRAAVVSETKGSMFGNIIFGGGIGAVIDHNNGAAYEYPSFIQVVMGAFARLEPPPKTSDGHAAVHQQAGGQSEPVPAAQVARAPDVSATQLTGQAHTNREQRLEELKRLFDKGLISRENYLEQQRLVLSEK